MLEFEFGFWLMALDCLLTFSIMFTIIAIGTNLMQDVYGFSQLETGVQVTLPYLVGAVLLMPLGYLFDKYGNRQIFVILCGFNTMSCFILFLCIPECDKCTISILPWYLLGISQAMYYVLMWGSFSYLVKPE